MGTLVLGLLQAIYPYFHAEELSRFSGYSQMFSGYLKDTGGGGGIAGLVGPVYLVSLILILWV